MVFAALVCWHGTLWSLLCADELLSQTEDLGASLSQRLPAGTIHFPTGKKVPAPDCPRSISGGQWGSLLSLAALQKTPPKYPSWCDHHMFAMPWMSSSHTKSYSKPLTQQFFQNGINWPNSHFPVESVPTPFPILHLCCLLHTLVISHVVGM